MGPSLSALKGGEGFTKSADSDEPYGDVAYADPGYQPDGKKRYPIDREEHIRAAWAYIHRPDNAAHYTHAQLAEIEARIAAAWRDTIDAAGPPAAEAQKYVDQPPQSPISPCPDLFRAPTSSIGRIAKDVDGRDDPLQRKRQRTAELEGAGQGDRSGDRVGANGGAPSRLRALLAELCDLLDAFPEEDDALAALAVAGTLRKSRRPEMREQAAELTATLAKLAGDIMPRLDALQRRVEDIANTPLPPLTAGRGLSAIAKHADGHTAFGAPSGYTNEDIAVALAQMTDEERTLTLIKAARATPFRPTGP